jgi:hypothetical protein
MPLCHRERELQASLPEHGHLPHVCWSAVAAAGADDGENIQRFERRARDKHTLDIRAQVRRVDQKTFSRSQAEIVGHEAFEKLSIFELDSNPQAFGARTRGESLARQGIGVAEFAHEEYAFDIRKLDADNIASGIEQLQFAVVDKMRRRDVTVDGVAVGLANDDFFMR